MSGIATMIPFTAPNVYHQKTASGSTFPHPKSCTSSPSISGFRGICRASMSMSGSDDEVEHVAFSIGSADDYIHNATFTRSMTPPAIDALPASSRAWRHDPYKPVMTPYAAGVVPGISHQPLLGKCSFVTFPTRLAPCAPLAVPADAVAVQVEQVKFEMSTAQLRCLLRKLTGVTPIAVEPKVPGSFVAWVATTKDALKLQQFHRVALFDQLGVWIPANAGEVEALTRYTSTREFRQRGQRLPRDRMSITLREANRPSAVAPLHIEINAVPVPKVNKRARRHC